MPKFRYLSFLTFSLLAAPAFAQLNDTGIDFCADATTNIANCSTGTASFPRQDGHFVKPFSFTKIANNGTELPASATLGTGPTDWACTKDNVTGLIWEVKTDDNGLRDKDHTYTWYNPDPATNGGAVGATYLGICGPDPRECNTWRYVRQVNLVGLCGANDWRMPMIDELEKSIVDFGRVLPAIDPTYFPNISTRFLWSNSTFFSGAGFASLSTTHAWYLDVSDGSAYGFDRSTAGAVWLVRGGR